MKGWRRVQRGAQSRDVTHAAPNQPDIPLTLPLGTYSLSVDEATSTLVLESKKSGDLSLHYTRPDADHLTLEGAVEGATVVVKTKLASNERFNLLDRGFHWVSESPANW